MYAFHGLKSLCSSQFAKLIKVFLSFAWSKTLTKSFKWRHWCGLQLLLSLSKFISLLLFSRRTSFILVDWFINCCCCCLFLTRIGCGKAVCNICFNLKSCLILPVVSLTLMTYSLINFKSVALFLSCLCFFAWILLCQTNKTVGFSCQLLTYLPLLISRF